MAVITLTHAQLEEWAGRSLTDADTARIEKALPFSTLPDTVGTIAESLIPADLERLRAALRAENISYGELHELQGLAEHIDAGDVELLEAAGVPEFPED